MYTNIYELPSQVLASLDTKDAEKWMKAYNDCKPKNEKEIKDAKKKAWKACKNLPSSFSFRIKATVDNIDKDREIIDVGSVRDHMDSYIDYGGNVQWEHGGYNVATIWDWEPIKVDGKDGVVVWGNVFGGDIVYDQMRKAFVEGKNSLSVAGEAAPGKFQCDDRGCYTRRNVKQLMEISLCAVPANNMCKMEWYNEKARIAKSASAKSEMRFNVDEYEIHKTYNECPMLSLKKSLEDIGYETHATNAGIFVKMDDEHFKKALPYMYANNLHVIRIGDDVCINDADYLTELSFKKGYREGFISADGEILSSIKKSDFEILYDRDVIVKSANGRYYLNTPGGWGHVEKKNKAEKKIGQQATDAMKENQQAKIQEQMDIPGMDDDEPYEWITSGILGEWQRGGKIEPDKITNPDLSRNMRSGKPSFFYVNQLGMPKNTVYASRRNSHGGSHWLESWKMMDGLDLSDKDVGQFANGISFDLNPNARHLVVNNKQEWQDLLKKYPLLVKNPEDPDGEFTMDKDKSVLPNWDAIAKDYDSMYMSPQLIMYLKAIRNKNHAGPEINLSREIRRQPLNVDGEDALIANMDVEGPDHMFIFNPNAILRQKPYRYNESAKPTKMDYEEKNRKYPSYSQQAFKNQAQGKIQSEARVIPKEWMS